MINGHGDDRHHYSNPICADFSSNVWFGGTPADLIAHLQQNMDLIGRYPEPDAAGFCGKIADMLELSAKQVLAFNGSVEAFYTISLAFRKEVSAIRYPAFSEYEDACLMHRHSLSFFRSEELELALKEGANLCWIGNPNNPDGYIFSSEQIEKALKTYPETIFVVDEAYAGLVPQFQSVIPFVRNYSNLIVVRSLTKCCAIPGLRLGYVVASERLAGRLRRFQQPWAVNALAQEAGKFMIDYLAKNPLDTAKMQSLSMGLQKSVDSLDGFSVLASELPFFLVETQVGNAFQLKKYLLENHGILIRDASNFRGLNEHHFRISTRDEKDNQLLINGLLNWNLNRYE